MKCCIDSYCKECGSDNGVIATTRERKGLTKGNPIRKNTRTKIRINCISSLVHCQITLNYISRLSAPCFYIARLKVLLTCPYFWFKYDIITGAVKSDEPAWAGAGRITIRFRLNGCALGDVKLVNNSSPRAFFSSFPLKIARNCRTWESGRFRLRDQMQSGVWLNEDLQRNLWRVSWRGQAGGSRCGGQALVSIAAVGASLSGLDWSLTSYRKDKRNRADGTGQEERWR